jgi:hypothetical protein
MKHLCLFLIFASLIPFIPTLHAQDKSWNLLLEKNVERSMGYQVYEADSFYIVLGTSIDSFGTAEQGFSISKVNKVDGSLIETKHYEEPGVEFDFHQCRNGYIKEGEIYFPQTSRTKPYSMQLFKVNQNTLNVEKLINIPPPDTTSKYDFFLNDFLMIGNECFILTNYFIGEYNTPSFKGVEILIKYDLQSKETNIIRINRNDTKIAMNRLTNFNGNILIFGTLVGELLATGKMAIFNLDRNGNNIWEYQTPALSPIHNIKDIYPINNKEVMLVSYDSYFDYSDLNLYSRWTVTRFDVENKKIVWSNFWNEPRKPYIWDTAKIVKTKKEGEFLLVASDYVTSDTSRNTMGQIIKFNDKGQRLWHKTYYFYNKWVYRNDFSNIINTSDENFLIVGTVAQDPWLVKIDEDGNILPIDTTSSTGDIYSTTISLPEIKVYPNPASNTIIINQGEITGMTYLLTDIHGRTIKSIPLPHAHHHVVWDISDVVSGAYVLQMRQGDKVIGTKQIVVVK